MKNISIFLQACTQLHVKTRLSDADIERLKPDDWQDIVKCLQSYSHKMEKNDSNDPTKMSFKVNLDNLKLSMDQLIKEWEDLKLDKTYGTLVYEDEVYLSPYEELDDNPFNYLEEPTTELEVSI